MSCSIHGESRPASAGACSHWRGNANSTVLSYAGRLAPEKNLPLLFDAVARLDPAAFRLAIAGSGILRDELERTCAACRLSSVVFPGHLADRETLADYVANADIFVHPDPRELFGIAALDAMAAGTPVIVPNTSWANTMSRRALTGRVRRGGESARANPRERGAMLRHARMWSTPGDAFGRQ